MSKSKDINQFPSAFFGLYEKALKETFTISCKSAKERTLLLQQLHAFRRAAEENSLSAAPLMRKVMLQKGEGFSIIFRNRDHVLNDILASSGIDPKELEHFQIEAEGKEEKDLKQYEGEVEIFNKYVNKENKDENDNLSD